MGLEPGLTARVKATVEPDLTARSQRSGDVEGLGTSAMIRLMEEASLAALEGRLSEEMTSVGTRVDIVHVAPTPVGMGVTAYATLLEIEGRLLVFSVTAEDERGVVGKGTHERVIVRREGFAERLDARWAVEAANVSDTLPGR